ncbi:hypothetical protein JCM1840_002274 [Sporobolomyces johnsonii]
MASQPLHDCTICDNKTSNRCSGCRLVYFCSRDCQRLLWPTHKAQCGRDPTRFHLPALQEDEAQALSQINHLQFHEDFVKPTMGTPMEYLEMKGLYSDTWPELVNVLLLDQTCPIPEPKRSIILITLRHHLGLHLSFISPLHSVASSAYQLLSLRYFDIAMTPHVESNPSIFGTDPFTSALLPWFRQALVFETLRAHTMATESIPPEVTRQLILKHLDKMDNEVDRLPIDQQFKSFLSFRQMLARYTVKTFALRGRDEDEAHALSEINHLQFRDGSVKPSMGTPMEYLEREDLYSGTWPELINALSLDQSCPIPEPKRSKILIALRHHLFMHLESARPAHPTRPFYSVVSGAYGFLSTVYMTLTTEQFAERKPELFGADPFASALLPWFRQALVYCTLWAHDSTTRPLPPHLLLKHKDKLYDAGFRLFIDE